MAMIDERERYSAASQFAASASKGTSPRLGPLLKALFFVGLFFNFGSAFSMQLEYSGNEHTSSKILQIANLFFGVFAFVMVFTAPKEAWATVKKCVPIFLLTGLAFASILWSTSTALTLKACFTLLLTNCFGLALAARLPGLTCLPFVIRAMSFGCLLSIIWVIILPETSIHQATDTFQSVHAGLWRGIFTHKQGLGTFAGFTTGLLLFYGRIAFPNIVLRLAALACAATCVWGSGSATAIVMTIVMSGSLYLIYWVTKRSSATRKSVMTIVFSMIAVLLVLNHYNALSFIPALLGKSDNLSGRGDAWLVIQQNFAASGGRVILGGGFSSAFLDEMADGFAIDSGYFKKLLEFGYLGSAVLAIIFGRIFLSSVSLVISTSKEAAAMNVFPLSLLIAIATYSITETGLMEKHITSIFLVIAVYIIAKNRPGQLSAIKRH